MIISESVIIYAVRYALGRMSYAVGDVCDYVKCKKNELSEECKKIIVKEIRENIAMCHRMGIHCGMLCDERDWLELVDVLLEE